MGSFPLKLLNGGKVKTMLLSFIFTHVGNIAPENGGYNAERFLTVVVK